MTTQEVQLGFNLGRPWETVLATIGGGVIGGLTGGPFGCFSGITTAYYIINKRWESAEERAHQKRESNKSDIILENSRKTKETIEKTSWLSCRIIVYACIAVGSLQSYAKFDMNKYSFCTIDQNSLNCSRYTLFSTISGITALVMPVIGLFDYLIEL